MNEDQNQSGAFEELPAEPLFMAISRQDEELQSAYNKAAETLPHFIEQLEWHGRDAYCAAKLRFRDPDESERLGEDRFVFLWLTAVHYHEAKRLFSGVFFEVPPELQKWHQVGQRLGFEPEDIFDWMINRDGRLQGGFTIRVTRAKLAEDKREAFDRHLGVTVYEPLPR